MSTNFYKIPQGIVHQLSSHLSLSGRLLLPCDLDGQLAAQLNQQQLIATATKKEFISLIRFGGRQNKVCTIG
jgi:hypothetical protein